MSVWYSTEQCRDPVECPSACAFVAEHQTRPGKETNLWGHSAVLLGPDCLLLNREFLCLEVIFFFCHRCLNCVQLHSMAYVLLSFAPSELPW